MMRVVTTTAEELAEISSALHDEWFLLDQLEHDVDHAELRLPIYARRWRKRWLVWIGEPLGDPPPPPTAILLVRRVAGFSVEDQAEVGSYGLSHLAYDPAVAELRIVSNLPCEIVVRTQELDVELLDR